MLRLYGDLAINGIIRFPKLNPAEIDASVSVVDSPVERILPEGQKETVHIKSFATYVKNLNQPLKEVVKSPKLLASGYSAGRPMCDEQNPEDLLRVWLDSYNVRGSFDDRTLVVVYPEVAS
jgi:hypothetical protein